MSIESNEEEAISASAESIELTETSSVDNAELSVSDIDENGDEIISEDIVDTTSSIAEGDSSFGVAMESFTNMGATIADPSNFVVYTGFKVVFALIFVIALIGLFKLIVQKSKKVNFKRRIPMEVVNSISLGSKQKVVTCRVGNELLVLGVTPQNINKLHNMTCKPVKAQKKKPSFSEELQKVEK